jgi:hypothetical protein
LAVFSNSADGLEELGPVDGVMPGEHVDVGEVAPSRVDGAPPDRGHDLLGVHHRQGVSAQDDLSAEQPRQAHVDRGGADRVAHVRVDVEVGARCRELCPHRHPNAAVDRLVSSRIGSAVAVATSR